MDDVKVSDEMMMDFLIWGGEGDDYRIVFGTPAFEDAGPDYRDPHRNLQGSLEAGGIDFHIITNYRKFNEQYNCEMWEIDKTKTVKFFLTDQQLEAFRVYLNERAAERPAEETLKLQKAIEESKA